MEWHIIIDGSMLQGWQVSVVFKELKTEALVITSNLQGDTVNVTAVNTYTSNLQGDTVNVTAVNTYTSNLPGDTVNVADSF